MLGLMPRELGQTLTRRTQSTSAPVPFCQLRTSGAALVQPEASSPPLIGSADGSSLQAPKETSYRNMSMSALEQPAELWKASAVNVAPSATTKV